MLLQQREAELQTQNHSLDAALAKLGEQNANLAGTCNVSLGLAALVIGIAFGSGALLAWHEFGNRKARGVAPGLLTLAICGLNFTAVSAVTIAPDPAVADRASGLSSTSFALVASAVGVLVVLARLVIVLVTGHVRC